MTDNKKIRITFEESLMMAVVVFMSDIILAGSVKVVMPIQGTDTDVGIERKEEAGFTQYCVDVDGDVFLRFNIVTGVEEFSGVVRGIPFLRLDLFDVAMIGMEYLNKVIGILEESCGKVIAEADLSAVTLDAWAYRVSVSAMGLPDVDALAADGDLEEELVEDRILPDLTTQVVKPFIEEAGRRAPESMEEALLLASARQFLTEEGIRKVDLDLDDPFKYVGQMDLLPSIRHALSTPQVIADILANQDRVIKIIG